MLPALDQFLQCILCHRNRLKSANHRNCMSADRDQSASKLFEVSPTLSLLAYDSAVHPLDLSLILAEIVVQVYDVKCHVLVEQRECSGGRKSSTDCHDHVFRSQGSRWVGRVRLYANVYGPRFAVDLEVNE